MGLADVRAMRETQVEKPFNRSAPTVIQDAAGTLMDEVRSEVIFQGVARENIEVKVKAHLRYESTDTSLEVDAGSFDAMLHNFEDAHRQQFGFVVSERPLIIEAVSVEGIGVTEQVVDPEMSVEHHGEAPKIDDRVTLYTNGTTMEVPLYKRESLQPGHLFPGPAIITEDIGTVIVEDGWQASLNARQHLILTRYKPRPSTQAIGTKVDPVMLEVFNNLFMSIAEQMGATLGKTAYSVNIKERLDFSCAIFDAQGQLVANAPHVPVHLGSMGESVKAVINNNQGTMRPGNVYMLNAPYNGGTHLPDVTVITPVFDDAGKEVLFYVGARGHHADIGGRTPGSSPPDSTHIDDEGVLIDNFLLVEQGVLREKETRELLASGQYPCRNIDQNMADLAAQVAANKTGQQELLKMIGHFGLDVVQAYMGHVQDNAEESVRRVIDILQDGEFSYPMDGGNIIKVKITVDRTKREALLDFSGTSPQNAG